MQMSAIPPATAQRVASLKSSSSNSSLSTPNTPTKPQPTTTSSRLTAQTASSMQKLSDPALRGRGQLPTIAGSPSVGSVNSVHSKEPKDMPPSALLNSLPSSMKETPTRIPRISSRTSAVGSPTLKNLDRRASVNINGPVTGSTEPSPIQGEASFNEFGVLENGDASISKPGNVSQRLSIRGSPSSRVPRQVTAPTATVPTPRKSNRDSVSFGLRKASVGSVASTSSIAPSSESQHRFSALSPSKGFKMLAPKMSLPTTRSSASQSVHQGSPSSSRQSLSTPSPVPSTIDEEELAGDEEMLHYIRRQQTKKMANGASQKELDDLLSFPDPLPPGQPSSPECTSSEAILHTKNTKCLDSSNPARQSSAILIPVRTQGDSGLPFCLLFRCEEPEKACHPRGYHEQFRLRRRARRLSRCESRSFILPLRDHRRFG